jgi:hypothetical protein
MRAVFACFVVLGVAVAQLQDLPVGFIDFYALNALNPKELRAALTVREGDKFRWPATREQIREDVTKAAGRPFTHFAPVCCDKKGRLMLYIGFGTASSSTAFRAKPTGDVKLSPDLMKLDDEFMAMLPEALKKAPGLLEDYSQGYSVSKYAPMRAIQMRMREVALAHEKELLRVLAESADDKQRVAAAHLTGYTRHSPEQIAALVDAARDPNDTVRNNATRALAVLAAAPEFARGIPAEPFIQKLNSPVWSDRNKGLMLLVPLTRDRDRKVLELVKARALDSLIEMAQWQNPGHSGGPIRLLGRIAGMDESVVDKLADAGDAGPVIAAVTATPSRQRP